MANFFFWHERLFMWIFPEEKFLFCLFRCHMNAALFVLTHREEDTVWLTANASGTQTCMFSATKTQLKIINANPKGKTTFCLFILRLEMPPSIPLLTELELWTSGEDTFGSTVDGSTDTSPIKAASSLPQCLYQSHRGGFAPLTRLSICCSIKAASQTSWHLCKWLTGQLWSWYKSHQSCLFWLYNDVSVCKMPPWSSLQLVLLGSVQITEVGVGGLGLGLVGGGVTGESTVWGWGRVSVWKRLQAHRETSF